MTCPIELFPATSQAEKTHFHQIITSTGHRLRQQMVDEQTGRVVDADHKGRGYELSKGHYVQIEEDELKAVEAAFFPSRIAALPTNCDSVIVRSVLSPTTGGLHAEEGALEIRGRHQPRQGRRTGLAGKLQSEIARTLGVSVMTLHRWRKGNIADANGRGTATDHTDAAAPAGTGAHGGRDAPEDRERVAVAAD